ncbi:MAG: 50S ribosomal protein L37 [Planctomycetota bacterium]
MSNRNNRRVKKANHGKRPANHNRRQKRTAKFKN